MRAALLAILCLTAYIIKAQQPLSASARAAHYTYVYKISMPEAITLYRSGLQKIEASHLHTRVDSFPAARPLPALQGGNYILLKAYDNIMEYELLAIGGAGIKLIDSRRGLSVIAHDQKGAIIDTATLFSAKTKLSFNAETQSYKVPPGSKEILLIHGQTAYYYPLHHQAGRYSFAGRIIRKITRSFAIKNGAGGGSGNRRYTYYDFFQLPTPNEKKFRGYMSFSKPVYRPGDTVRMKAAVLTAGGKGYNKELRLRLTSASFDVDTVIALIKPYRPGGFTHQFVLDDSLDIDLDENYLLALEEAGSKRYDLHSYDGDLDEDAYASKRKVVMRGRFRFEEYELQNISFKARTALKEHGRGETNTILLRGTDENDLSIMDGRLQLTLIPSKHTSVQFFDSRVFLKDTLWQHEQALETIGETRIAIPDSIFPAASFDYTIECVLLNSNNERHTVTLPAHFMDRKEKLSFELAHDSIAIGLRGINPPPKAVTIETLDGEGKTVQSFPAVLPARIRLQPFIHKYRVSFAGGSETYEPPHGKNMVNVNASRTADSLFVNVVNPHRLPFWYTLYYRNKAIQSGSGDSLFLARKAKNEQNYTMAILYVFGGRVYNDEFTIYCYRNELRVSIHAPSVIHPGQEARIEVEVRDFNDKPVAGADVTAFSFTKKFRDPYLPYLPYLGKTYPLLQWKAAPVMKAPQKWTHREKLNWERWSRELRLDTMEYFKFLHPAVFYLNTEAVPDSITQLAPFVVVDGEVQPIHLLYIDEQPHFFSASQHLQRYSFRLWDGVHSLRIRTHDRTIRVPRIHIRWGVKNIISINGAVSNDSVTVTREADTLSIHEKLLIAKYSILMDDHYGEHLSYIEQDGKRFLLPGRGNRNGSSLVGPLYPAPADLVVHEKFRQPFIVENGYRHRISPGLVRQKEEPLVHSISKKLSPNAARPDFSERVLTAGAIERMWVQYLNNRSAQVDIFYKPHIEAKHNGALLIRVGIDRDAVPVKNIFLYQQGNTDFLRVYRGNARDLGYLHPGGYSLLVLLNDGRYLLRDSVTIRPFGINYYFIDTARIFPPDTLSRQLESIIRRQELESRNNSFGLNDLTESFNQAFQHPSQFTGTVYGKVTGPNGDPLPHVAVHIKGTRYGTSTGIDGRYELKTPARGTLVFSSIGYETVESPIMEGMLDISLSVNGASLQEVVVTGYAPARQMRSVTAYSQALAGKVAGVMVRGSGGLTARGESGAAPLIVVDGVVYDGRLDDLDPSILANISLLKEDVAVTLYGARGANGAIIVTTKKSAEGETMAADGAPVQSIRKHFRDDAFWQPVLQTGRDGRAAFTTTFPDDITSWRTFAYAVTEKRQAGYAEGSVRAFRPVSANITAPLFAVESDSISLLAKTLNYETDSIFISRRILINENIVKEGSFSMHQAHIDTVNFAVLTTDSLSMRVEIRKAPGYADGEERSIPVFRKGVLETRGLFAALEKDTVMQVSMNPALGKITLHAESSPLPVLLEEAEKIHQYEYLCNEQLASKLKALLVQKKIHALLKKDFRNHKAIRELIGRLQSARKGNLWGWWAANDPLPWISLHVVEALLQAEKEGYPINLSKTAVIDYLVYSLESYNGSGRLFSLRLLKALDAKVDCRKYIDSLEKKRSRMDLHQQLQLTALRQQAGLPVAIDSLMLQSRQTMFGNIYWGDEGHRFFDNSVQNTLLVYRILKNAGGHERTLARMRHYFLEKRSGGAWRNTYESSLILETILPELLVAGQPPAPGSLVLSSGEKIESFPFHREVDAGSEITVEKRGDLPVYFTAYQQSWNASPAAVSEAFTVSSQFIENGMPVTQLKAGTPVVMEVKVQVRNDADYVMVEIPIPAGCSYREKPQPYRNNEVHREYFKNKVSIFCSSLKPGTYHFSIPLLPRYTGMFTLNPARAEMMYFPVFYGRESMKKLAIR